MRRQPVVTVSASLTLCSVWNTALNPGPRRARAAERGRGLRRARGPRRALCHGSSGGGEAGGGTDRAPGQLTLQLRARAAVFAAASTAPAPEHCILPILTPPEATNTGPGFNRGSGGGARGCGSEERVGAYVRTEGVISYSPRTRPSRLHTHTHPPKRLAHPRSPIPPLSALTSRATHAHPTSPRSTGFCAIWGCISSSFYSPRFLCVHLCVSLCLLNGSLLF